MQSSESRFEGPAPSDAEEFYALADECGLINIRDRIGEYLMNNSTGKTVLQQLCRHISLKHPVLYEAYYEMFKSEWGAPGFRREFVEYLNEIEGADDDEKERVHALLRRAVIEMQFSRTIT
jgi:hypothetical protein